MMGNRHLADQLLEPQHLIARGDAPDFMLLLRSRAGQNGDKLLLGWHRHPQLEEEAVKLCLGQRVRPLHLNRILCRQYHERRRQPMGLGRNRHLLLLHRFKQCRLRFRRRTIDLVGQEHVGEERPRLEPKPPAAAVVFRDDVRAGDVGRHQVGRELNTLITQRQRPGQRADQARFAHARHPFQEHVAAGKEGNQHPTQHLVLPYDDGGNFAGNGRSNLLKASDRCVGSRIGTRTGSNHGTVTPVRMLF